jgi:2-dehydro-3-deoxyphosphogluconate aldolase/(4S)-4-hydroxy-2-oxoglutarate aldolase
VPTTDPVNETPETPVVRDIRRLRIVPVIVIHDAGRALALADALASAGLPCAEITFRTPAAAEALRQIVAERPDVLAGAGTVLTTGQAARAKDAGARFIVSPGINPKVVAWCQDHDLPVFPGVCTPTEIETALGCGLSVVKFFPAEQSGGLAYLKAIAAPFPDLSFMPTGGINAANAGTYLGFKRVVACGGSWMAAEDWIAEGAFDRIRQATRDTLTAIGQP